MAATGVVITTNVAEVAPAITVTLTGTCATAVLPLDRLTTAPPGGAAASNLTVPVDEVAPTTEVGFSVNVLSAPAITVMVAVLVAP